jgi:hypothetical protein
VAVITAASQSFHFFEIPGSVIEGFGFDRDFPEANDVYLIGPAAIDAAQEVLSGISPGGVADLADLEDKFEAVADAAKGFANAFDEANSHPGDVVGGCIFDFSSACIQLVYDSGFASVADV